MRGPGLAGVAVHLFAPKDAFGVGPARVNRWVPVSRQVNEAAYVEAGGQTDDIARAVALDGHVNLAIAAATGLQFSSSN